MLLSPTSATPCHTPPQHWPPQRQDRPMPPTPSPTYERLRETIAKRMRMSNAYQPLMHMELLGRRSPPRAGRSPPDPGGRRDPDRFLRRPNGLDVIRTVANEALGPALMAKRFSRRRRGGCQTIANPDGISAAIKDGVDIDR